MQPEVAHACPPRLLSPRLRTSTVRIALAVGSQTSLATTSAHHPLVLAPCLSTLGRVHLTLDLSHAHRRALCNRFPFYFTCCPALSSLHSLSPAGMPLRPPPSCPLVSTSFHRRLLVHSTTYCPRLVRIKDPAPASKGIRLPGVEVPLFPILSAARVNMFPLLHASALPSARGSVIPPSFQTHG